jgi:hypothetical protein
VRALREPLDAAAHLDAQCHGLGEDLLDEVTRALILIAEHL